MNSIIMKRSLYLLTIFIVCIFQYSCMTGSEIPNEISGTLVTPDGLVQSNVPVSLFPVEFIPDSTSSSFATVTTNNKGEYLFVDIPSGTYNLLAIKENVSAFKNSITYESGSEELGEDTLRAHGSIVGYVHLEPYHNSRYALVQVIGTDIYTNVDTNGLFELSHMAEGIYRIKFTVINLDYMPEYRVIEIHSGQTDTLKEAIRPLYLGEPRLTGLKAVALNDGSIKLTWNKINYSEQVYYAIFREPRDASYGCGNGLTYSHSDTIYVDTIYSKTPKDDIFFTDGRDKVPQSCYNGQWFYDDTTAYKFRYRIWRTDVAWNLMGLPSEFVNIVAIPPTLGK